MSRLHSRLDSPLLIVTRAWIALGALATPGLAGDPPTPAQAPKSAPVTVASVPSDPVFAALLTDGTTVAGRVIQVDAQLGVTLAGPTGDEQTIRTDRLVKLTREGASFPSLVEGGIVLLPHGDRLARCVIGMAGELTIDTQPVAMGNLAVPIDGIVGLIINPPAEVDAVDLLEAKIRTEPRDAEQLWLVNGDKLDGFYAGMTDKQITFRPKSGAITLGRPGVVAIGFTPTAAAAEPIKGPYFEWLLLDGSRVGLTQSRVDRGMIVGTMRVGLEVRVPVGEVARVRVLNANVAYLSDRDADKVVYESYLGPTRPYRRGTSVAGPALRLGGQTFDKGLGTQSRTLLAYRLDSRAKRFQATIGLDDAAGPLGNVLFKVLVDGKVRYESPSMGAGYAPRPVDVDLEGGKVLILITEFGERGDVQDSGDWVEARIIQ